MHDVRSIAHHFGRAAQSYDAHAQVQARISAEMAQKMSHFIAQGTRVLDVGAGTGSLARLAPNYEWIQLDAAEAMCQQMPTTHRICADGQWLPLPDRSVDAYVSSMAWQWMQPWERTMAEMHRVLRPHGTAIVATLVEGTLRELHDTVHRAAIASPLLSYTTPKALSALAVQQNLRIEGHWVEQYEVPYPDAYTMLKNLKHIGAIAHAQSPLNVAQIRALCRAYPQHPQGGVVSTYVAGWWVFSRTA